MHGKHERTNLIHIPGESVVDVDALSATLARRGLSRIMFARSYVVSGCDFSAGTSGVSHVHYLRACVRHAELLQSINEASQTEPLQNAHSSVILGKSWV